MEFLGNHIYEIASSLVAIFLGFISVKYNGKYTAIRDFLSSMLSDLEDGKLTPEEIQDLVNKGKKIVEQ